MNKSASTYVIDLHKLLGDTIDHSLYSYTEEYQCFTPTEMASRCLQICNNVMYELGDRFNDCDFFQPSAGQERVIVFLVFVLLRSV